MPMAASRSGARPKYRCASASLVATPGIAGSCCSAAVRFVIGEYHLKGITACDQYHAGIEPNCNLWSVPTSARWLTRRNSHVGNNCIAAMPIARPPETSNSRPARQRIRVGSNTPETGIHHNRHGTYTSRINWVIKAS